MNDHLALAEGFAKKYMLGFRQSSTEENVRPAWSHPQDVVNLLVETLHLDRFGVFGSGILQLAWLHDVIEDGKKSNGLPISSDDLRDHGFDYYVVCDVQALTQDPLESKPSYLARLVEASPRAKLVKLADRVCNLREGKVVFDESRWDRYVDETQRYILPLALMIANIDDWWGNAANLFSVELKRAMPGIA